MKKGLAIVAALMVGTGIFAQERIVPLVKIQGGENFSDATAKQALSEEHGGASNVSVKVDFSGDSSIGAYNPKLKNWKDAKTLQIKAFNPAQDIKEFVLVVVPKDLKGRKRYEGRSDNKFILKPGDNTVKLDVQGFTSNDGQLFDLSDIVQFYICAGEKNKDAQIFFQSFDLIF